MKRFWLFRSNLKSLEYYHEYKDLSTFIKKCHDYYMLLPLWLLQSGNIDEVTIWRLTKRPRNPIVFDVDGKKYIQRWVQDFSETLKFPKPDMSFWRGGFREYDQITKSHPKHFGVKIYLGAGQRINAQWGGKYDVFLMEDDDDIRKNSGTYPFYKTASPFVFHRFKNTIVDMHWDICWPCNFTQIRYKGQEFFIREIAKSKLLRRLKIVHCGNKPEVGKKLCKQYGVSNIEFLGSLDRVKLNEVLNSSLFGLNLSNRVDGCPRVSTEVLMSGTPLIIHEKTRLLSFYKKRGVVEVNDDNIAKKIINAIEDYTTYKADVIRAIDDELSFDKTNQKNIDLWLKLKKI
jgi:glycosyltransferase involved in cell wall biosynthesis